MRVATEKKMKRWWDNRWILDQIIQANGLDWDRASTAPNLKGYFGANEGSMKGVVAGVHESGKDGKIVQIGYDAGKYLLDGIRSGVIAGAITQDPIGIGYKCVDAALKASKGEKLPKTIDTGFHWYDKTNIDDPAIAALLYN